MHLLCHSCSILQLQPGPQRLSLQATAETHHFSTEAHQFSTLVAFTSFCSKRLMYNHALYELSVRFGNPFHTTQCPPSYKILPLPRCVDEVDDFHCGNHALSVTRCRPFHNSKSTCICRGRAWPVLHDGTIPAVSAACLCCMAMPRSPRLIRSPPMPVQKYHVLMNRVVKCSTSVVHARKSEGHP